MIEVDGGASVAASVGLHHDTVYADAPVMEADELLHQLDTSAEFGLSESQVTLRQKQFGKNEMEEDEQDPIWLQFLETFKEPLILLLLASAAISIFIGQVADAIGILVAVLLVNIVGFYQEYSSERSVEALKKLAPHTCKVIREGRMVEITSENVVCGDMVVLNVGDHVPADVRLVEAVQLHIDESLLTGESTPVSKVSHSLYSVQLMQGNSSSSASSSSAASANGLAAGDPARDASSASAPHYGDLSTGSIHEHTNMAYMGSAVISGRGLGVVVAIGGRTQLGQISDMLKNMDERKTPLQRKMEELGRQLSMFAFAIVAVIFVLGSLQGKSAFDMFIVGVSLAVAAIPEGLPIVVTVTLALGVTRMAKRRAIVRKLPAVEALGSTTIICSDKTGTLTQNAMTVTKLYTSHVYDVTGVGYEWHQGEFQLNGKSVYPKEDAHLSTLLRIGLLCNNAQLSAEPTNEGNNSLVGLPTEGALVCVARKAGLPDLRDSHPRIEEIPFDSIQKWMAVRCESTGTGAGAGGSSSHGVDNLYANKGDTGQNERLYYVKGATEKVLEKCNFYCESDNTQEGAFSSTTHKQRMTKERVEQVLTVAKQMGDAALRVVAMAYGSSLNSLTFVGLAGIMDPPKEGVREAIDIARLSGVKVAMITGDAKETAMAVASSLNLPVQRHDACLSGPELEKLSGQELKMRVNTTSVFYRVSPQHKMKIVEMYKELGHVVAMTGDGVNDAPALKMADIGICMGMAGSDVAKEASEMILVDDNFATIIAAIEEGKSIFSNIKNFLRFQLTTSIAAMTIVTLATVFGMPIPFNPTQILWVNIIMDGPPAQSLGLEPLDQSVMRRPPRDPNSPVIDRNMVRNVALSSVAMLVGTLALFFSELNSYAAEDGDLSNKRAMTVAFTTFVMFQMFNALNCRSEERSAFQLSMTSNVFFLWATVGSVVMQLLVIYVPFLQYVFDTVPLTLGDLCWITLVSSSVFWLDEVRKWMAVRKRNVLPTRA